MKNRSELREIIMKVIYQVYIFEKSNIPYDYHDLIKDLLEVDNEFVNSCVEGIIQHQKEITRLADQYLDGWKMSRLNKVDQAIISLGIYELKYTDTPSVVAINEAIELSKRYSDSKVTKMINAVLDGIYHNEEDYAG